MTMHIRGQEEFMELLKHLRAFLIVLDNDEDWSSETERDVEEKLREALKAYDKAVTPL